MRGRVSFSWRHGGKGSLRLSLCYRDSRRRAESKFVACSMPPSTSRMDDLKSRIKEASDRVSLSKASSSAEKHRTKSSSISTEAPIEVLAEIREGQARLLDEVKKGAERG